MVEDDIDDLVVVGDADHRLMLVLELLSGHGMVASNWSLSEWWAITRRLKPREGRVLVLRYLHEMTQVEIGERLECSRGLVDQLMRSAERRLRLQLIREDIM
jgi:DNA-directed RNA polymerase specialized sigma24 family protein